MHTVSSCHNIFLHTALHQALDTFLAMSSMYGYTGTLVLILVLGGLAYYTSCWPLGLFVGGEQEQLCTGPGYCLPGAGILTGSAASATVTPLQPRFEDVMFGVLYRQHMVQTQKAVRTWEATGEQRRCGPGIDLRTEHHVPLPATDWAVMASAARMPWSIPE